MNEEENIIEEYILKSCKESIYKAINTLGIEGTEESINKCYANYPIIKQYMLQSYNEILRKI